MSRFYITTPLYYVNDKPHLGSAYSTVLADVLTRYHRLFGEESLMLTGVDEHGQKVQQAAEKRGLSPQAHADELSQAFRKAWDNLNIKYDIFFRTTDDWHKKAVQDVLQELWDKSEIYDATYEGWYCVSEEIFYTEKELVDGKTPSGKEVIKVEEKNYFFKMSKYQEALLRHIHENPEFIQPASRRNEVIGFLKQPLGDLCISRPKSRLSWGIEIPFDRDYVTYVWFDALLNYATGVGFHRPGHEENYKKWWEEAGAVHLIGKDILITHTVYWPTMLMAAGARLPKTIFAHGWILNKDNEKMSKSKGSVMDPNAMAEWLGVEALRYYLAHDVPMGHDAPVSHELMLGRVNNDLANNLGNLLSRSTNLVDKFFGGKVPEIKGLDADAKEIAKKAEDLFQGVKKSVESFALHEAIDKVLAVLNDTNKYLEQTAPWKSAKENLEVAAPPLYVALEVLRFAAITLHPIMPEKTREILRRLGIENFSWNDLKSWGALKPGAAIVKGEPLFPRIEIPKSN